MYGLSYFGYAIWICFTETGIFIDEKYHPLHSNLVSVIIITPNIYTIAKIRYLMRINVIIVSQTQTLPRTSVSSRIRICTVVDFHFYIPYRAGNGQSSKYLCLLDSKYEIILSRFGLCTSKRLFLGSSTAKQPVYSLKRFVSLKYFYIYVPI